jgi:hypothetical protein
LTNFSRPVEPAPPAVSQSVNPSIRKLLFSIAAAAGGLALFGYAVRAVGLDEIGDGIRRVGWGLVPILALAGLRFMLRAQCWRLCMPPRARLSFGEAFTAFLAGDAVGNLTPLGLAASEPTKVFLTRHRLATRESIASLAVDNLVYAASVLTVVALGAVLLLATAPLSLRRRDTAAGLLVVGVIGVLVVFRLLRGTWSTEKGARPRWRERLAIVRESVLQFSAAHPSQLRVVYALHLMFHALAMLEVYLTLRWVLGGSSPTFAQAAVFEALNRVLTAVFKFVPFRVGVDEMASGALALQLGIPAVVGVTGAVVRKVRNLTWTGVGLALIAVHRGRAAQVTDPPGKASARRT